MALTLSGNWDGSINSPVLVDGSGTVGDLYYISASGMQDLGDGTILYNMGMSLLYTADNKWKAFAVSYKVPLNEVYAPGGPGVLPPYPGEPVPNILSYIVDVVGNTSGSTSGSTIPNLEQVTLVGNSTDQSIIFNTTGGTQTLEASANFLKFKKDLSPYSGTILPGNLTSFNKTYTLPDNIGTIALVETETLQLVTDHGNTTNNNIAVIAGGYIANLSSEIISTLNNITGQGVSLQNTPSFLHIRFTTAFNGDILPASGISAPRTYELPDKSGIIALVGDFSNTSGTVTSFSTSGISTLFTTNVTNSTTTPNLIFSPISQAGNKFFASPNSTSGIPLWRSIVGADIPLSVYQTAINTSGSTVYVPYLGAISNVDLNNHSLGASQININTPSFTSGVLNINGNVLLVTSGATPISLSNAVVDTESSVNSYLQHNTRNASNGTNASSDYIATADTGTDSTNFIDVGINGSGFSQPGWTINGALDGYVYTATNNLAVGTASIGKVVDFFTGGTLFSNRRMRIDGSGNISMYQFNTSGGVLYTNTSGLLTQTTSGITGQVMTWNNGPVWGNSGTSGITSFSSPDNSIFTSGVTTLGGTVQVVEINTANSNTWTGLQIFDKSNIVITPTPSISISNSTLATAGIQNQYSPSYRWTANSWNGSASISSIFEMYILTNGSSSSLQMRNSIAGGAFTTGVNFGNNGGMNIPSNTTIGGVFTANGNSQFNHPVILSVAQALRITTGTNAITGIGTFIAGVVTIITSSVTSSSLIWVQYQSGSGITKCNILRVSAQTAGTSFVVGAYLTGTNTVDITDTQVIQWWIIN